jgi:hypothetical protein
MGSIKIAPAAVAAIVSAVAWVSLFIGWPSIP